MKDVSMSELFVWKDEQDNTVAIRSPSIYRALCEIGARFGCPLRDDMGDKMVDNILDQYFNPSEKCIPWSRQDDEC